MRVNGAVQLYPMLRVGLALAAGITLGDRAGEWFSEELAGIVVILLLLVSWFLRRRPLPQSVGILLTIVSFGAWLIVHQESRLRQPLPQQETAYEAVVVGAPVVRGKTLQCDILVANGPMAGRKVRASILRDTIACRYAQLHIGDGLRAISRFEPPQAFPTTGRRFDFVRWMECQGFSAHTFIYYRDWEKAVVDLSQVSLLERSRLQLLELREELLASSLFKGMDADAQAVVEAMTLGDKRVLRKDLKDVYAVAGGAHVLALSGLHLSIIASILFLLFRGRRRYLLGHILVVATIWLYVFLVGMPASVVRAAVMLTVYALVDSLRRDRVSLNTWALAAVVMLVAHPLYLWDVGFQMSFMAVLGIILFARPLSRLLSDTHLSRFRLFRWGWSLVAVSLAAQIGVGPLVVYYFGRFPCYFILTNLIVVPCAWLILYGSFCVWLLAFVPPLQRWLAEGVSAIAALMNGAMSAIASWPGASIEGINLETWQLVLVYLFMACWVGIAYELRKLYRIHRQFRLS